MGLISIQINSPYLSFHFCLGYAPLDNLDSSRSLWKSKSLLFQSISQIYHSFHLPLFLSKPRCSHVPPKPLQSHLSSWAQFPLSPTYHRPCHRVPSPPRNLPVVALIWCPSSSGGFSRPPPPKSGSTVFFHCLPVRQTSWTLSHPHTVLLAPGWPMCVSAAHSFTFL